MADLQGVPETLGHYKILRQLGTGGMGEVYLAEDSKLGRKVAIKLLPAELTSDDDARRRLLREARSVASLDHPNVCTIHEIGEDHGRSYVVMQFIDGETLAARMSRSAMTRNECIEVASQIASGLSNAHSRGVVHRDIKPANVMIDRRGQVKVLDFGLAKAFVDDRDSATDMQISKTGTISGTTPYMSPEQLRGETLDGRSDIFSLGVMLHEIATGRRPFDRPSTVATITAILFETPPPIASPEFAPLESVIRRCLEKDRNARFQTGEELLQAFRRPPDSATDAHTSARPQIRRSVDPQVEQLCVRGRIQWNKRHPEAVRQAIALYQQAIELDPMSAVAWSGLADCYNMMAFLQAVPPSEILQRTKAAAARAIQLDPMLAEPHAALGYAAGLFEWDFALAEHEMRQSMRLDPRYPWAPHWLGLILTSLKRFDEAIAHLTRAQALDPLSPIINVAVGIPYYFGRRYDEAIAHYQRVEEVEPVFGPAHYYIGMAYEQRRQFELAAKHLNKCVELTGRAGFALAALGHCQGVSGHQDQSRQVLADLHRYTTERYISPFNFALVHLGLGEIEETLTLLEASNREHTAGLALIAVDPRFDVLRSNPRFDELSRAIVP